MPNNEWYEQFAYETQNAPNPIENTANGAIGIVIAMLICGGIMALLMLLINLYFSL